jgi:hypothetical protein
MDKEVAHLGKEYYVFDVFVGLGSSTCTFSRERRIDKA